MFTYKVSVEQILDWSVTQFNARVKDCSEIPAYLNGTSKGRITRTRRDYSKGVTPARVFAK